MFAKLCVVILMIGATGCWLLALRQQRLDAAGELARIQVHVRVQDERLWKLRSEIAQRVNPEHVREMAVALGPLRPIVPVVPGALETRIAAEPAGSPLAAGSAGVLVPVGRGDPKLAAPKVAKKNPPKYAAVEPER